MSVGVCRPIEQAPCHDAFIGNIGNVSCGPETSCCWGINLSLRQPNLSHAQSGALSASESSAGRKGRTESHPSPLSEGRSQPVLFLIGKGGTRISGARDGWAAFRVRDVPGRGCTFTIDLPTPPRGASRRWDIQDLPDGP
jgi:hypothetical protein